MKSEEESSLLIDPVVSEIKAPLTERASYKNTTTQTDQVTISCSDMFDTIDDENQESWFRVE